MFLHASPLDEWRGFALRFRAVKSMVGHRLTSDFSPADLTDQLECGGLSSGEASIFRFLLHTWDSHTNPFELSQASGWDRSHLEVLATWVMGDSNVGPFHYF